MASQVVGTGKSGRGHGPVHPAQCSTSDSSTRRVLITHICWWHGALAVFVHDFDNAAKLESALRDLAKQPPLGSQSTEKTLGMPPSAAVDIQQLKPNESLVLTKATDTAGVIAWCRARFEGSSTPTTVCLTLLDSGRFVQDVPVADLQPISLLDASLAQLPGVQARQVQGLIPGELQLSDPELLQSPEFRALFEGQQWLETSVPGQRSSMSVANGDNRQLLKHTNVPVVQLQTKRGVSLCDVLAPYLQKEQNEDCFKDCACLLVCRPSLAESEKVNVRTVHNEGSQYCVQLCRYPLDELARLEADIATLVKEDIIKPLSPYSREQYRFVAVAFGSRWLRAILLQSPEMGPRSAKVWLADYAREATVARTQLRDLPHDIADRLPPYGLHITLRSPVHGLDTRSPLLIHNMEFGSTTRELIADVVLSPTDKQNNTDAVSANVENEDEQQATVNITVGGEFGSARLYDDAGQIVPVALSQGSETLAVATEATGYGGQPEQRLSIDPSYAQVDTHDQVSAPLNGHQHPNDLQEQHYKTDAEFSPVSVVPDYSEHVHNEEIDSSCSIPTMVTQDNGSAVQIIDTTVTDSGSAPCTDLQAGILKGQVCDTNVDFVHGQEAAAEYSQKIDAAYGEEVQVGYEGSLDAAPEQGPSTVYEQEPSIADYDANLQKVNEQTSDALYGHGSDGHYVQVADATHVENVDETFEPNPNMTYAIDTNVAYEENAQCSTEYYNGSVENESHGYEAGTYTSTAPEEDHVTAGGDREDIGQRDFTAAFCGEASLQSQAAVTEPVCSSAGEQETYLPEELAEPVLSLGGNERAVNEELSVSCKDVSEIGERSCLGNGDDNAEPITPTTISHSVSSNCEQYYNATGQGHAEAVCPTEDLTSQECRQADHIPESVNVACIPESLDGDIHDEGVDSNGKTSICDAELSYSPSQNLDNNLAENVSHTTNAYENAEETNLGVAYEKEPSDSCAVGGERPEKAQDHKHCPNSRDEKVMEVSISDANGAEEEAFAQEAEEQGERDSTRAISECEEVRLFEVVTAFSRSAAVVICLKQQTIVKKKLEEWAYHIGFEPLDVRDARLDMNIVVFSKDPEKQPYRGIVKSLSRHYMDVDFTDYGGTVRVSQLYKCPDELLSYEPARCKVELNPPLTSGSPNSLAKGSRIKLLCSVVEDDVVYGRLIN